MENVLSYQSYLNQRKSQSVLEFQNDLKETVGIVKESLKNSKTSRNFENSTILLKGKKDKTFYIKKVGKVFENISSAKSKMIEDEISLYKKSDLYLTENKINVMDTKQGKFLFTRNGNYFLLSNESFKIVENENLKISEGLFDDVYQTVKTFIYATSGFKTWTSLFFDLTGLVLSLIPSMKGFGALSYVLAGTIHFSEFADLLNYTYKINMDGEKSELVDKTAPMKKTENILDEKDWKELKLDKDSKKALENIFSKFNEMRKENKGIKTQEYIDLLYSKINKKSGNPEEIDKVIMAFTNAITKLMNDDFYKTLKKNPNNTKELYPKFYELIKEQYEVMKIDEALTVQKETDLTDVDTETMFKWFGDNIGVLSMATGCLVGGAFSMAEGLHTLTPINLPSFGGSGIRTAITSAEKNINLLVTKISRGIGHNKIIKAMGHFEDDTFKMVGGIISKYSIKGKSGFLNVLKNLIFGKMGSEEFLVLSKIFHFFMKLIGYTTISQSVFSIIKYAKDIKDFIFNIPNMVVEQIKKLFEKLSELMEGKKMGTLVHKNKLNEDSISNTLSYGISILYDVFTYSKTKILNIFNSISTFVKNINFDFLFGVIPTENDYKSFENFKVEKNIVKVEKTKDIEDFEKEADDNKGKVMKELNTLERTDNKKEFKKQLDSVKDNNSLSFEEFKNSGIMERSFWDLFKNNKTNPKFVNQPTQELKDVSLIEKWLKTNNITKFTINGNLTVDVYQNVRLSDSGLYMIPVKFGKVMGDFHISGNYLKDLKNCPYYVKGSFICEGNKNLISLVGGPTLVGGDYSIRDCKIYTLDGIASSIKGELYIGGNAKYFDYYEIISKTQIEDKRWHNACRYAPKGPDGKLYLEVHFL